MKCDHAFISGLMSKYVE